MRKGASISADVLIDELAAQLLRMLTMLCSTNIPPMLFDNAWSVAPGHNYLRDWIYGGIDGAVTTLAVVTGVAGAQLSKWIILALGFANLFADKISLCKCHLTESEGAGDAE